MDKKYIKKGYISILAIIGVGVIATLAIRYNKTNHHIDVSHNTMRVVVTIPPLAEFVERIMGGRVDVTILVPQGADPHTYEPTPSQLQNVSDADIYVAVGSGIEFETAWQDKIVSLNKKMIVINASEGMTLMEGGDDAEHDSGIGTMHSDPHVWTSPKNAIQMVEHIASVIGSVDVDNAAWYERNKNQYIAELEELDKIIGNRISQAGIDSILVLHPAWGYFARDYGIMQYVIEDEGKEPGPKTIQHIIEVSQQNNISIIFTSPEFSSKSAELIATEINAILVPISPLARNYVENMRTVAESIARAGMNNE